MYFLCEYICVNGNWKYGSKGRGWESHGVVYQVTYHIKTFQEGVFRRLEHIGTLDWDSNHWLRM